MPDTPQLPTPPLRPYQLSDNLQARSGAVFLTRPQALVLPLRLPPAQDFRAVIVVGVIAGKAHVGLLKARTVAARGDA